MTDNTKDEESKSKDLYKITITCADNSVCVERKIDMELVRRILNALLTNPL